MANGSRLAALLVLALLFVGCGQSRTACDDCFGSQVCSEGVCVFPPSGDRVDSGTPDTGFTLPTINGFNLPVKEGSWWEYRAVYHAAASGVHDDTDDTYVLKLGASTQFDGQTWYPVKFMAVSSTCDATGGCTTYPLGVWYDWSDQSGWQYLSFDDRRIVARTGETTSVLFDANTGIWPATSDGMFEDFPSDTGTRIAKQTGNNWTVGESNSSDDCTDVPGYGVICGGQGYSVNDAEEVYDPAIGCISSRYFGNSTGGTGATRTDHTTLVDSSVRGDRPAPAQTSCTPASSTTANCSADMPLVCGSNSCCPNGYPYACASSNLCYSTVAEAIADCGSVCVTCS